jgi:hypothetical protein
MLSAHQLLAVWVQSAVAGKVRSVLQVLYMPLHRTPQRHAIMGHPPRHPQPQITRALGLSGDWSGGAAALHLFLRCCMYSPSLLQPCVMLGVVLLSLKLRRARCKAIMR